ncbi:ThuA domain-containing protein [Jatrophihabitans telluris]|uniref:ThuA domain-containing protein n=1 Tax=Jatrophihabitans telluris TaxID=2038343 RepID=A0ABY4R1P3_9ACTN|nr:ThuA domain-containing protein [Jatrophihabitans telluris]UQX89417.1 ThuA domain-containing protein [Jatrophihabitans telluris]
MTVRALALVGDPWHPTKRVSAFLRGLSGLDLRWPGGTADALTDLPTDCDLVILAKGNHLGDQDETPWLRGPEAGSALVRFVESGGGLLVLHSGTVGYQQAPLIHALIGGRFIDHPPIDAVTLLGAGIERGEPLGLTDEFYRIELTDVTAELTASLRWPGPQPEQLAGHPIEPSEDEVQPAGWRRRQRAGRVAVLTPGHTDSTWAEPAFRAFVQAEARWAAGSADAAG